MGQVIAADWLVTGFSMSALSPMTCSSRGVAANNGLIVGDNHGLK
jgi:hypothetical protein